MQTYVLENTADSQKFQSACQAFEEQYPDFRKCPAFEDKRNNALYLRYERGQSVVIFTLETLWQQRVTVKTNIDLTEFLRRLGK